MDGYYIQQLAKAAKPGCTKCHGRLVTASSWSENQSPLGSGMHWPEQFYEEDICDKCADDESINWLNDCWDALDARRPRVGGRELTAFEVLHWNCVYCALNQAYERSADADMEMLFGQQDIVERLCQGLGAAWDSDDYRARLVWAAVRHLSSEASKALRQSTVRWEPVTFTPVRRWHLGKRRGLPGRRGSYAPHG